MLIVNANVNLRSNRCEIVIKIFQGVQRNPVGRNGGVVFLHALLISVYWNVKYYKLRRHLPPRLSAPTFYDAFFMPLHQVYLISDVLNEHPRYIGTRFVAY